MESREIRFYRKDVYGVEHMYPVDYSKEIYLLTGKKTLTPGTIAALGAMGYAFREVLRYANV